MTIDASADSDQIERLTSLSPNEVAARLSAGHRIYIASIDGVPAAYGWVATLPASIGELALEFTLPSCDRYLWDFATLPRWRGRGTSPRLLQAVIEREGPHTERFWITYAPENAALGSGHR